MNYKIGPGWLFVQQLDADGIPTGTITNLGFNREVKIGFKSKKYEIEADNSSTPVDTLYLGLEKAEVTCDIIEYGLELLASVLGESPSAIESDVLSISGMSAPPKYRIVVVIADIAGNPGESIYTLIDEGSSIFVDVYEFRYASIGGSEVVRGASPDKEETLPFVANALTKLGLNAIPAKAKFRHELTDASVLNNPAPGTMPVVLFTT